MADEHTAFQKYALGAAERLGPDTHCSILLGKRKQLTYAGSSDDRARMCDAVEVQENEGPCVTAMLHLSGVLVPDIRAETAWPAWRQASLDVGFRSAAALPAYVDNATSVALNLYSEELDPWDRQRLVDIDAYVQEIAEAVRLSLGD